MARKIRVLRCLLTTLFFLAAGLVTIDSSADQHEETTDQKNAVTEVMIETVKYITLRNHTGNTKPDDKYGDERSTVRTGECELSYTPFGLLQSLSENGLVYIPENKIKLKAVIEIAPATFWHGIASTGQGQRPTLYLHGYNTSFVKSCEQASLFQTNLNLGKQLILFSWPSDGALLNYSRDESDLFWSVAPLEATLNRMIEQFGSGGFDVVAHSLGARGLFLALVQLAHQHHEKVPLLNQLVFTAPDIDVGIFQQHLPAILPLAQNITVYVSNNDRPLALSREVHGYPRLGESGSHLNMLKGIQIIDISDVGVRSFSGHLYHLYHESVANDLNQLLNLEVLADQRNGLTQTAKNRWRLLVP